MNQQLLALADRAQDLEKLLEVASSLEKDALRVLLTSTDGDDLRDCAAFYAVYVWTLLYHSIDFEASSVSKRIGSRLDGHSVWENAQVAVKAWQQFDMPALWTAIESEGFDGNLSMFDNLIKDYAERLRNVLATRISCAYTAIPVSTAKTILHFEHLDDEALVQWFNGLDKGCFALNGDCISVTRKPQSSISNDGDKTEQLVRLATFLEQAAITATKH